MLLVGTDEAGYGPNLGPLVVAASAWRVDAGAEEPDLAERLAPVVVPVGGEGRAGPATPGGTEGPIVLGDSKALYAPGGSLARLERGVLAGLEAVGRPAASWRALPAALGDASWPSAAALPWHADFELPLPVAVDAAALARCGRRLAEHGAARGARLVDLRARQIHPAEFNAACAASGSKGTSLTRWTLELVAELLAAHPGEPALVVCDKHGGRNRYVEPLQAVAADALVEVLEEGRARSRYRWGRAESRVEIHFQAGGEAFLPSALASMTAKYVRELAMRAFNAYWQARVAGLRPTAGYPVDAARFDREIDAARAALGISRDAVWRAR